jgi:hypothetical protein
MNNSIEKLQVLCKKLGLSYESQDWGIINATPSRLIEFIDYYKSENLTDTQKYNMIELIMASANEGLIESQFSGTDLKILKKFILEHGRDVLSQWDYWKGLPNSDEYPILKFLKDVKNKA